jgi:hypothetical protein
MRLLVTAALVFTVAGSAGASVVVSFRTPSGNIGCTFASGLGPSPNLRCDIRSGLRPRPPRPRSCELDWGFGYSMGPTGRARVVCAGDTALVPRARVLRYGSRWSRAGFTCKSRAKGLRCANRSGHGFFLSRARSYRF